MTSQDYKVISRKVLSLFMLLIITATSTITAQDVEQGKALFTKNCTSCHTVGKGKLIGPDLVGINDEHESEWLFAWIRNSSELIASGDEDAIAIFEEYNKTQMTAFPQFSDEDLSNILAFIAEGPEVVVAVAGSADGDAAGDAGASQESLVVLMLAIALLILALFILNRVKNILKETRGEETKSLLKGALSWVKSNPVVLVFFCIFLFLYGGKVVYDGLLSVGVQQGYQPEQPIAFSHKIHAGENGIDCNYCHSGARHSKTSGIPSANVCMNCHTYINSGTQTGTEEINKIYAAIGFDPETRTYIEGYEQQPIQWVRIHNLPDLAYFNHSQHVSVAGVECQTCHGPIEEMDVVEQHATLTMAWCIDCHKETPIDTDNPYYHDLNENWVEKYHGEEMTVDKMGGLECGKCHY